MNFRKTITLALIALWSMTFSIYSQNGDSSAIRSISQRNTVSLFFTLHKFPDKSPVIQFRHLGFRYWSNINLGLEYERRIGLRHGVSLKANFISISYFHDDIYPTISGEVVKRTGLIIEANYKYAIIYSTNFPLSILVGVNRRIFDEYYLKHYFGNELLAYGITMKDWGATLGMEGRWLLTNHLSIPLSLRYSRFFGNYENAIADAAPLIIKPTMSYLKLQFGISLDF
jgi:hypothetical protein